MCVLFYIITCFSSHIQVTCASKQEHDPLIYRKDRLSMTFTAVTENSIPKKIQAALPATDLHQSCTVSGNSQDDNRGIAYKSSDKTTSCWSCCWLSFDYQHTPENNNLTCSYLFTSLKSLLKRTREATLSMCHLWGRDQQHFFSDMSDLFLKTISHKVPLPNLFQWFVVIGIRSLPPQITNPTLQSY